MASAILANGAFAQEGGSQLPTVQVVQDEEGENEEAANTNNATTGIGRLPGTIQDTPQTVNVVTPEIIQQQNITRLDQALRNVPGVTVSIGEGNGGMNGDQFRIRGFQAKGDIYVDGLRDFGVYVRDAFSMEQVEVFKGPSSESFGMGTGGGAINSTQKRARLEDFTRIEGTVGTGPMGRAVVDVNRQIDDTTAARIVAMIHQQDIVDRDHLYTDRWGVLGSFGVGLGTDTQLILNYFHQSGERLPDMGAPIITPAGQIGKPVMEWGVPRENYFGKETDLDDGNVDMLTSRFQKKVNDWLTIYNDTRLAFYDRYFAQTVVSCPSTSPTFCTQGVVEGNFDVPYAFGGPAGFDQSSWGAQNVTTAVAKFHTGILRHELVAGIDTFFQHDWRVSLANSLSKVPGTIGDPLFENQEGFYVYKNPTGNNGRKISESTDFAIFASDRLWFTDQLSVLGGVRWDKFDSTYEYWCNTAGTCHEWRKTDADTEFASPKVSLIFEPTPSQNYYASWAKSFAPQGAFVTNENVPINPSQEDLDPEISELWELGAKINVRDGKLGFTGAIFRVDKSNSSYVDPATGDSVVTGEKQRVEGIELGVSGYVTDPWLVQFAYTHMRSEILTATTPANVGNEVAFVPHNVFSLWTTYDLAPAAGLDGKLLAGGGVTYSDKYFTSSANTAVIPSSFVIDGLVSYEWSKYRVALNGYNLADVLYYDNGFGNRATVAAGRTVMLTVGASF